MGLCHAKNQDRLGDGRLSEHRDARPGPEFGAAPSGHPAGLRRGVLWTGGVAVQVRVAITHWGGDYGNSGPD